MPWSGGMCKFEGVAARGLVNGRGPRRSRGRDEVGTCSDEPTQTYPTVTVSYQYKYEEGN